MNKYGHLFRANPIASWGYPNNPMISSSVQDAVNPYSLHHRPHDLRPLFDIQLVHDSLLIRDNLSLLKAKNISAELNAAFFLPAFDFIHIDKRIALKFEGGEQPLRQVIPHHGGLNVQFLGGAFYRERSALRGNLDLFDFPFTHDHSIHDTISRVKPIAGIVHPRRGAP